MVRAEDDAIDSTALEESLDAIQSRRNRDAASDPEHVLKLAEDVGRLHQSMRDVKDGKELLDRAHAVLQLEMIKLQDHLAELLRSDSIDAVAAITQIAKVMFTSGYELECRESYVAARKAALEDRCFLDMEELVTIEQVSRMEWKILNDRIGVWIKAMKDLVRAKLPEERRLCGEIFGELSESASRDCFCASAKTPVMRLLGFAFTVALAAPAVERLFRVLDVYDTLLDLRRDIESLDLEDTGATTEVGEILGALRCSGREAFLRLGGEIERESSPPDRRGGLARVTRYVMNYVQTMATTYQNAISSIFDPSDDDSISSSSSSFSLADHVVSLTSTLESALRRKSGSYSNVSLQHLFLMDNLRYMVQKVRGDSHLESLVGETWLRDHIRKYKEHARCYVSESFSPVLYNLSNGVDRNLEMRKIKNVLKTFNLAFEELYRIQTGWLVHEDGLRKDLCLKIIQYLVPIYRHFLDYHRSSLEGLRQENKYVKYTPEFVEERLWDFLAGSPKSLSNHS